MKRTAQEAYAHMMKHEIAPALRRPGFKGSGMLYELPSTTAWATLGFQKSAWSDKTEIEFTVNVSVIDRAEWMRACKTKPFLGERPSPSTFYGNWQVGWQQRLGHLMPGKRDRWWKVRPDRPTEPIAGEVVSAIQDFALPAMRVTLEKTEPAA